MNSPKIANAANAPVAVAKNCGFAALGSATRCGRFLQPLDRLRHHRDSQRTQQQQHQEQLVRPVQRLRPVLRKQPADERPEGEAAEIHHGGDQRRMARVFLGPRDPAQLGQVSRCGRRQYADADARHEARKQQAGHVLPDQEDHRGQRLGQYCEQRHPATAEPVADVAGQVQADHHAHGIRGEDDRDHEGRKAVPMLVDGIERRRNRRERHRRQEGDGDHPEAGAVREPNGRTGLVERARAGKSCHGSRFALMIYRVQRIFLHGLIAVGDN